jgi:hypothetical protein
MNNSSSDARWRDTQNRSWTNSSSTNNNFNSNNSSMMLVQLVGSSPNGQTRPRLRPWSPAFCLPLLPPLPEALTLLRTDPPLLMRLLLPLLLSLHLLLPCIRRLLLLPADHCRRVEEGVPK